MSIMQERHSIIDKVSRELKEVQFVVAIRGASQYTYAEASMSQHKEDFVRSVDIESVNFDDTRNLDRNLVMRLASVSLPERWNYTLILFCKTIKYFILLLMLAKFVEKEKTRCWD